MVSVFGDESYQQFCQQNKFVAFFKVKLSTNIKDGQLTTKNSLPKKDPIRTFLQNIDCVNSYVGDNYFGDKWG